MATKKSNKSRREKKVPKISRSDKLLFNKIRKGIKGSEKEILILQTILRLVTDLKNSDQWFYLGQILSDSEIYDCADMAFNRVVTLNPHHSEAWRSKALVLGMLHRGVEAAECYKRSKGARKKRTEYFKDLDDLANYIDELVVETEDGFDKLHIDSLNAQDIDIIVPDTKDMDGFIADLLNYIARDQNEARHLLSKLDIQYD